ncbi:MAG: acyltransferase [Chitinophagaceae bacterium]|nr:acyltransferase [Chitinophagaceae bacterium]
MRTESLTFTRFIAAVALVMHHFGGNLEGVKGTPLGNLVEKGNTLVSFFFVLSGFILVVSYKNRQVAQKENVVNRKEFYINRIARIYPLYLFALLLYLLLPISFKIPQETPSLGQTFSSVLLIQAVIPKWAMSLNYPGWSLSVEAFFYILFPFLFPLIAGMRSLKIITVIITVWILNIIAYSWMIKNNINYNFRQYHPLVHVSTFIFGMGSAVLFLRHTDFLKRKSIMLLFLTFSGAFLALFLIYTSHPIAEYHHNGMFAPVFATAIILLASGSTFLSSFFSKRPLIFLGEISYGIYILQVPILFWLKYMNETYLFLNKTMLLLLYFVCLVSVSVLTFYYIEDPLRKLFRFRSKEMSKSTK